MIGNVQICAQSDTVIRGIDAETGHELWKFRTRPWRYTELIPYEDSVLFGTSGQGGYLYRIQASTGEKLFRHKVDGGVSSFSLLDSVALVAGYNGLAQAVSLDDGSVASDKLIPRNLHSFEPSAAGAYAASSLESHKILSHLVFE